MFRMILLFILFFSQANAKELRIIVPSNSDGYNLNARVLARHYDRYLRDNPTIIIQAMPGAAGMVAASYIYGVAPSDGSVIGTVQKNVMIESIRSNKIDPSRFTWIGSTADGRKDAVFIWSNKNKPIDHYTSEELILSADSDDVDLIRNSLKIRIRSITGYSSGGEIRLAVERGEVDAAIFSLIGIKTNRPQWLSADSKIRPMIQYGNGKIRHADFQNVPTLTELVRDKRLLATIEAYEKQYTLLRPFIAPPNVPISVAQELRDAFYRTVNDREYLEDMRRSNIDVNPVYWQEAEQIVRDTMRFYEK